jgi:hypothetical protein
MTLNMWIERHLGFLVGAIVIFIVFYYGGIAVILSLPAPH